MTGGKNPIYTKIDRIDYSNDTATATVRGVLSSSKYSTAGVGNKNYGWVGGGVDPSLPSSPVSSVDRMEYASDTATATPKGPLSRSQGYIGSTGNADYGWFGGGYPPTVSLVDRIDYSLSLIHI